MIVAEFKSILREKIKKLLSILIRKELLRKRIILGLYNIRCFFRIEKKEKNNEFLFNPKALVKKKKFIFHELYKGNCFYGIANNLKEYCGYKSKIYACIEHGVYFGEYINENEAVKSGLPALITFGEQRKQHIRKKSRKKVFCIGSYIHYAKPLLERKEIEKYRKDAGKTLLVFPSHSIDRVKTDFNYDEFIEQIKEFKNKYEFKNVLICLYYRDIELNRHKFYENKGFTIVSAGRREDPKFLNRLRTFFELSDYSISNNVGTHIGYSVMLGVPHTVIHQEMKYNMDSKLEDTNIPNLYLDSTRMEKSEIEQNFASYSENITKEQINICNKYWGNNLIKSNDELFKIFNLCEEKYKNTKRTEREFDDIIK